MEQAGFDLLRVAVHAVAGVLLDELPFVGEVFVVDGLLWRRDAFGAAGYGAQPAQVAAGGDAAGVVLTGGAQHLHPHIDARGVQMRRRLKVLAVGFHNLRPIGGAHPEKVGVGERQAHFRRHKRRFVARAQQPHRRRRVRFVRRRRYLVERVVVGRAVVEIVDHIAHLLREMADVFGHTGVGEGGGGNLVAARRAPQAQVNAVGIEGVQHPKGFGHLKGAVMGQHHAAGTDADGAGVGGNLPHQHFGRSAGEIGQVVMLGNPIALVAQLFGGDGQGDAFAQGHAGAAALAHRRLVNYAQLQFRAQSKILAR